MPHSKAEDGLTQEEPVGNIPAEGADEQDQDDLTAKRRTFLEHAKEAMDEHETLDRLLAQ